MKKLVVTTILSGLALAGLLTHDSNQDRVDANWCKSPGKMSYWRSPIARQERDYVRAHVVTALRDGCFDGRIWSYAEINRVIPWEY